MKSYLVYGGGGFVGLHLCELLIASGIIPLGILDKSEKLIGKEWLGIRIYSPVDYPSRKHQVIICHSSIVVCNEIKRELEILGYENVDTIYHFAQQETKAAIFYKQRNIFKVDIAEIVNNEEKINSVMNFLADDMSKRVFVQILSALKNKTFKIDDTLPLNEQYFPTDIFTLNKNEAVIDIGGGPDGCVLKEFLTRCEEDYSHYYLIDACSNINMIETNYNDRRITFIHAAVSDINTFVKVKNYMDKNAVISDDGEETIKTIIIDNIAWPEKITFMKIDVEGYERKVLLGAMKTFSHFRPIVALAIYHNINDFWELPLFLKSQLTNYSYYLRSYLGIPETILYAMPNERLHS